MWRKKKSLSFLPPWEFQTPFSLGTTRLPINLPRKWLSHSPYLITLEIGFCHCVKFFSSVTQSCLTLCDPIDCSMPDFPVHHQLPESTQTHVHHISNAIQPSHPLLFPSSHAFNLSQHQGLFQSDPWDFSNYVPMISAVRKFLVAFLALEVTFFFLDIASFQWASSYNYNCSLLIYCLRKVMSLSVIYISMSGPPDPN